MKQILKKWSEYTGDLLTEVSFKQAQESLHSKKTIKIVKSYRYHRLMGDAAEKQMHDDDKEGVIRRIASNTSSENFQRDLQKFQNRVLDTVPDDLTDNQKGLALLWVLRVMRQDKEELDDLLNPDNLISGITPIRNSGLLEMYFHWQQFMEKKDLNDIADFDELEWVVDGARPAIKQYQEKQQNLDADKGMEVLRDDQNMFITAIHNKGAACHLGKGTDWCTAAPGLDYFEQYYKPDDPLFFFHDKQEGERYQFHYGSEQFMNEDDMSLEEEDMYILHSALVKSGAAKKYPIILEKMKYLGLDANYSSDPEILKQIIQNGSIMEQYYVANNPNASLEIIEALSNHKDPSIRRAVAQSENVSFEILRKLSEDEDGRVRYAVTNNFETENDILKKMAANDSNSTIRANARQNIRGSLNRPLRERKWNRLAGL